MFLIFEVIQKHLKRNRQNLNEPCPVTIIKIKWQTVVVKWPANRVIRWIFLINCRCVSCVKWLVTEIQTRQPVNRGNIKLYLKKIDTVLIPVWYVVSAERWLHVSDSCRKVILHHKGCLPLLRINVWTLFILSAHNDGFCDLNRLLKSSRVNKTSFTID